jgi:hypothetical protein
VREKKKNKKDKKEKKKEPFFYSFSQNLLAKPFFEEKISLHTNELYIPPFRRDEPDVLHDTIIILIFTVTRCNCRTFLINCFLKTLFFFLFALKLTSMAHKRCEKKSQVHLSVKQKLQLIKRLESGVHVAATCMEYGMKKQIVSNIIKTKSHFQKYSLFFDVEDTSC